LRLLPRLPLLPLLSLLIAFVLLFVRIVGHRISLCRNCEYRACSLCFRSLVARSAMEVGDLKCERPVKLSRGRGSPAAAIGEETFGFLPRSERVR
jgi:hypothetical protein